MIRRHDDEVGVSWVEWVSSVDVLADRWVLTAHTLTWDLSVREGLTTIDFAAETLDEVILRWAAIRAIFGFGPTPEELRSAAAEIERAREGGSDGP